LTRGVAGEGPRPARGAYYFEPEGCPQGKDRPELFP
jgi:hypothetical protein